MQVREEAPPGNGKGSVIDENDEALISLHRQPHRQVKLTNEEIGSSAAPVNIDSGNSGENLDEINDRIAAIMRNEVDREARAERAAELLAFALKSPTVAILDRRPDGVTTIIKTDPTNEAQVARAKVAIAHVYRHNTGRSGRQGCRHLVPLRIAELELYMARRYGHVLPEGDDAAREDLVILLNHIAQIRTDAYAKMKATARTWTRTEAGCSWMDDAALDELIALILKRPRRYSAKKLGELTGLTEDEHKLLGITSWWPHTWEQAKVRADQRERKQAHDRATKKAKRAASRSGRPRGRPRKEGVPAWQAAGFKSKRTYQRHKARGIEVAPKMRRLYKNLSYKSDAISVPSVIPASLIDGIDLAGRGIVAIRVMRGTHVVRAWNTP